jgi:chromosome partition protein MukE
MTENRLLNVLEDPLLPETDTRLRMGGHIAREDLRAYEFLVDAFPELGPWYERFGFDLQRAEAGFFYLRPLSRTRRRVLGAAEMLVGQVLALFLLDPMVFAQSRSVRRDQLRDALQQLVGRPALLKRLLPRRRPRADAVADKGIREEVDRALRSLEKLGFVRLLGENIELRVPLFRFTEPVRAAQDQERALDDLIRKGEVVRGPDDDEGDADEEGGE